MGRPLRTLLILTMLIVIFPLAAVVAQDPPQPPPGNGSLPPGVEPGDPPPDGQEPIIIPGAEPPAQTPQPPQPDAPFDPFDPLSSDDDDAQFVPIEPDEAEVEEEPEDIVPSDGSIDLIIAARLDIELLAGTQIAGGTRPDGWSGETDITNPQIVLLTRLDLEILAGTLLGAEIRPDGWFGVVASTPYAVARDIRHDLELLADAVLGDDRPEGWTGGEPILRCDRTTQVLVQFLELNEVFNLQADRTDPNFCKQAAVEASLFVELNFLANRQREDASLLAPGVGGAAASVDVLVNSPFAVGFYDRNAAGRAGVIPNGSGLEPLGRSYVQFSNMMLVRGEGFTLFIDFRFTDMSEEAYRELPDINALEYVTGCEPDWCAGR